MCVCVCVYWSLPVAADRGGGAHISGGSFKQHGGSADFRSCSATETGRQNSARFCSQPCMSASSRSDVDDELATRHVAGIVARHVCCLPSEPSMFLMEAGGGMQVSGTLLLNASFYFYRNVAAGGSGHDKVDMSIIILMLRLIMSGQGDGFES